MLVCEESAVGVAIEGDADAGFVIDDLAGYDAGVEGAAVLVDVAAVRAGVGDDDFAAESSEELWGDGGGGAIGAVDDDAVAVEGEAGNGGEKKADVLGAVGVVDVGWGELLRGPSMLCCTCLALARRCFRRAGSSNRSRASNAPVPVAPSTAHVRGVNRVAQASSRSR